MSYTETTSAPEFADYVATERDRLTNRRESLLANQRQLAHDIAAIEAEFEAIKAYERAKPGHKSNSAISTRAPRSGSKRTAVLELIGNNAGMSRGQLIDALGARGDKSAEMSISNALTALTKGSQVVREHGQYFAAQAA